MIKYRPHHDETVRTTTETKEFETIEQMKEYVQEYWNDWIISLDGKEPKLFAIEDIVISEVSKDESQAGWKNVRRVGVKRMGPYTYDPPTTVGWCGESD